MWCKRRKRRFSLKVEQPNLHKSMRFVFVIAQFFGYFPIQGVWSEKIDSVFFTWWSVRILSSTVTYSLGFLVALGHIRQLILSGYDQFEMNGIVFYVCGSLSCIFFIKLATEWVQIMTRWEQVDEAMASYGWPENLDRRVKIISIIFLILEATEHVLIQTNKIVVAIGCKGSVSRGFEHYFVNMSFPMIFDVIKPYYSPWLGVVLQVVNTRMAFSWTFIDLFIILISCALASRLRQINQKIRNLRKLKVQIARTWGLINEDYNRLCALCVFLDDKFSFLILISFFNNFYFIIFQIFGSLNLAYATTLETVYYFISLGLLFLRMTFLCLYGCWINDESKVTADLLSSTSHEVFNHEIEKFADSIRYHSLCLTGKKFFRITKQLILKLTSAVVTYELVVIQFSKNSQRQAPSKNSIC